MSLMKPFKAPTLVRPGSIPSPANPRRDDGSPAHKKRRVSDELADSAGSQLHIQSTTRVTVPLPVSRKPLLTVNNPTSSTPTAAPTDGENEVYYNVLWRKPTAKKHKTWDGDGILRVTGGFAYMRDNETGRDMGRCAWYGPLLPESSLNIAGKNVEVESLLPREEYLRGRKFLNTSFQKPASIIESRPPPRPGLSLKVASNLKGNDAQKDPIAPPPSSKATQSRFKNPLKESTIMEKVQGPAPTPRHDPDVPGALVMKRPRNAPKGKQIVDVVVDPILSRNLRDHQREGVKFLYECVMGMRNFEGRGAILADEMGLGKTLQTIALIWTLLKQNPIYGEEPVIKKVVVVCPVTLINNWKKEFRKWLGSERIGVFVVDGTKTRITDFTKGRSYSVMIIGYEKVRKMAEALQKGHGVDIIIADEGHRLKTAQNKAGVAMKSLDTTRRVILSGTPIQNDLSEFFSMVDFVNPGILGAPKSFTKQFEDPIVKSRQPNALKKDIEKGEARSDELGDITAPFILRRTADILSKYLPPKTEYVLMCKPTNAQATVYNNVLSSPYFQSAMGSPESHLQLITILKKVCNSPRLLAADPSAPSEKNNLAASLTSTIPPALLRNNASSSKLRVLDNLLHTLRTTTSEKVVLVSNFTATLDLLQTLLTSLSLPYLRLDGTTPVGKRQDLVDTFNRTPSSSVFAFLLSAKAGGMGLNLIGASRLVLFDVDWNPAVDAQAMARIHRDGQKRPCVIYRFLLAGAMDEKIWQRQVTKIGLAASIMESKAGASSFTREELSDLFRLDTGAGCQTHELIGCSCGGRGMPDAAATADDLPASAGEEEDELVDMATLLRPSSEVDMEAQETAIAERKAETRAKGEGAAMQSLMAYSHIDTSRFHVDEDGDMEALVRDEVLLSVLKDEENKVGFVFARTTGV